MFKLHIISQQSFQNVDSKHLLIIFHSQSGRSEAIALAAFKGARQEPGLAVTLRRAFDVSCIDLLKASALIIIAPENFGAIAGGMKDLFDRVYYPAERSGCAALPYALIISAGNDGSGGERQLERILTGLNAKKIQPTIIIHGVPDEARLRECSELAQAVVAGLVMGIF